MFRSIEIIQVHLWGHLVGALSLDPRTSYYAFEYAPRFIANQIEIAPLQMPLRSARHVFVFPQLAEHTYARLPALIADSLPDKFGNALIDAYMAQKGIAPPQISPLDRLAYMGKRAMGALEFKPVLTGRGPSKNHQILEMSALVDQARQALHGSIASHEQSQQSLKEIIQVGTSAGGARAKAVIAIHPENSALIPGQFQIPPGYEHWLIKFDGIGTDLALGNSKDYGRIEYAYAQMAHDCEIEMTECRLLVEGKRAHFMTRRFDRDHNAKHHIQTLCAMAHLDFNQSQTHDYNQLFLTCHSLGLDSKALEQVFRRMVFNVFGANCDDHSKNFAFRLRQGQNWELAPAYDITYAYNAQGQWTHSHQMSVGGKFQGIQIKDLTEIASRFQIPKAMQIIKQIDQVMRNWPKYATPSGIDPDVIDKISQNLEMLRPR